MTEILPSRTLQGPTVADCDASIIARAQQGDERAFAELYNAYAPGLTHFVYQMIGDRERAKDIVQETFLRVHKHFDSFITGRRFSTWVYTIARNLAKNEQRNLRCRRVITFTDFEGPIAPRRPHQFVDNTYEPEKLFHARELARKIEETISRMPPNFRNMIILRDVDGRSYPEIAYRTNIVIGTVKSRISRARADFAARYHRDEDEAT